jgi:hypothetical protein
MSTKTVDVRELQISLQELLALVRGGTDRDCLHRR